MKLKVIVIPRMIYLLPFIADRVQKNQKKKKRRREVTQVIDTVEVTEVIVKNVNFYIWNRYDFYFLN